MSALVLAVLLPVAAGRAPAAPASPPVGSISLDEISPGMTGYGLTVFRGSVVDTFGVTVIGVQENVRPAGSLLLIEVSGHGLETSSIAQGMSGSPIYLDGRFAGALAFGWGGSLRPIAGVTPAAEMLALPSGLPPRHTARLDQGAADLHGLVPVGTAPGALAADIWGAAAGPSPASPTAPTWPDAPDMWRQLSLELARREPALDPGGRSWVFQPIGLAGAGAGSPRAAGPALVPGAACAVPLVTGDAALGAIGTVTWVDGDRVLMMGHPFLQRGPVNLPLATAEILAVLPSREMSFKMGSIGEIVGAVHHDQRAGLAGRLGPGPDLIPVTVEVREDGGTGRTYSFGVVDDPLLTPTLVFWAFYNALLVTGDDASLQTVGYDLATHWQGTDRIAAAPLRLRGVTAGPGGAAGLASEVMAPLMILLNNAFAPVRLTKVDAVLERSRPLRTATITGLSSPRAVVQAGQQIVFQAELEPREGRPETVSFPVTLPTQLPAGPYRVVVASAADLFALEAQRAPGRFQPASLDGILDLLRLERSRDTLVLALFAPGQAVVVQGREMRNLPDSVARTVGAGNLEIQRSLADFVWRTEVRTDWVVTGHAVRNLTVQAAPSPLTEERRP